MKKIFTSILALAMICSLAACGGSSSSSTSSSEATETQNGATAENQIDDTSYEENFFSDVPFAITILSQGSDLELTIQGDAINDVSDAVAKGKEVQFTLDVMDDAGDILNAIALDYPDHFDSWSYINGEEYDADYSYIGSDTVRFTIPDAYVDFSNANDILVYAFADDDEIFFEVIHVSEAIISVTESVQEQGDDATPEAEEEIEETPAHMFVGTYYCGTGEYGTKLDDPDMTDILIISENTVTQTINGVTYEIPYGEELFITAEWITIEGTDISVAYEANDEQCNAYTKFTDGGYTTSYFRPEYFERRNSNNTMSEEELEAMEAEMNG